jgi:hypothetical protein
MQTQSEDLLIKVNDIVLFSSAILSIGVSLLDFLGVLDELPWLSERVTILILLSVSFLIISVIIERKTRLDVIQGTLDNIIENYAFGVQYLPDAESVTSELDRIVRQADECIMALGAKSRAKNYLDSIEDAIENRDVVYHRLINGTYIPHELHEHLREILEDSNVQISWTPREKFGNMTVTERGCILVFPAPYRNRFSGLRLPGETNSRKYTQYFLEVFSRGLPIRTERSIEILCEKCSPQTAGKSEQIRRVIEEELSSSFVEEQNRIHTDLL